MKYTLLNLIKNCLVFWSTLSFCYRLFSLCILCVCVCSPRVFPAECRALVAAAGVAKLSASALANEINAVPLTPTPRWKGVLANMKRLHFVFHRVFLYPSKSKRRKKRKVSQRKFKKSKSNKVFFILILTRGFFFWRCYFVFSCCFVYSSCFTCFSCFSSLWQLSGLDLSRVPHRRCRSEFRNGRGEIISSEGGCACAGALKSKDE